MSAYNDEADELAADSVRGDGLATGSAPQEGLPDIDEAVRDTARGGEGLADGTAGDGDAPDVDAAVKGTARGGDGLADDAA